MAVNPIANLDINPSSSTFMIDWDASTTPGIASQELWVSTDNFSTSGSNSPNFNNGTPINLSSEITSYSLGGLTDGDDYFVAVIAKTSTESSDAVSVSGIPGDNPQVYGVIYYGSGIYNLDLIPESVDNLAIEQISNKKYKLTWTAPVSGQLFDITGYRIWRAKDGGNPDIIATVPASGNLEYIDRIPSIGANYAWRITTLDEGAG